MLATLKSIDRGTLAVVLATAALLTVTSLAWYAVELHREVWVLHPFGVRWRFRGTWLQPVVMVALAAAFFGFVRVFKGVRWRDLSSQGRLVAWSSLAIIAGLWWWGRGGFFGRNVASHVPETVFEPLYGFFWFAFWCVALRMLIPLVLMRRPLRVRPVDFGYRLRGASRLWWLYLLLAAAVCVLVVIYASNQPAFLEKYPLCRAMIVRREILWWHFLLYQLAYLMVFVSGESFWRGYIAFGLEKDLGKLSLAFMIIPYVTAHFGKPLPETLGAIVTGLVLGFLALHHRSFWLGVVAHYGVALTMDVSALVRRGIQLVGS